VPGRTFVTGPRGCRVVVSLATAAGCFASVALGVLAPVSASATAATRAPARRAHHVLLVGVPGLRWYDITSRTTPVLWRLAGESSVGALSVRAVNGNTRRADGWLTLGSGDRARAFAPDAATNAATALPDPSQPGQLRALADLNRSSAFGAQIGALGGALHKGGLTTAVVGGRGPLLAAMDPGGRADLAAPSPADALPVADLVVDELPDAYAPLPGPARDAALRAVDRDVAAADASLGNGDLLIVAGVSDRLVGASRLTVAMAHGPGFQRRWLSSSSTKHEPFVQLVDVAPTILTELGQPTPAAMIGGTWTSGGRLAAGGRPAPVVARLVDLTDRSWAQSRLSGWFETAFNEVLLGLTVAVGIIWWRGRARRWLVPVALTVAAMPVSTWLVQLLPWWRWGRWSVLPLTVAWAVVVGQVAYRGPWRGRPWGPIGAVGIASAMVIALDVATGARLQLDAPFGDNPVVAGRFHGIGNAAFAVLAAGALLGAAALAAPLRRYTAAAVGAGVGLAAVVVDGLPAMGDDFGGVISLLPAVIVLSVLVAEIRVTPWRLAAVLGSTAAAAAAFALYDYSLPASRRSHVGRFVQQLGDGTAWTVVHRKLSAAERTVLSGSFRWVALAIAILAVLAWALERRGRIRVVRGEERRLASVVIAVGVVGLLGAGLNDSGVAITALAWAVAGPSLLLLTSPAVDRSQTRAAGD